MVKRIIGMIIGIILLGTGISIHRISAFGNDTISAFNFSIVELINVPYSVVNFAMNIILLIPMFIFMRDKINIGSLANIVLTGVVVDILMSLVEKYNIHIDLFVYRLLLATVGVFVTAIGVALYVQADMGLAPFDGLVIIVSKEFKLKYDISKIILDAIYLVAAFIISNIILKGHAVGVFTVISCVIYGPLIKYFGNIINRYIYRNDNPNIK